MMVGEFLTREFAVESTMTLVTGGKASFVESNRHVELAFIDPSDKESDKVVVGPGTVLERAARTGQPIDELVTNLRNAAPAAQTLGLNLGELTNLFSKFNVRSTLRGISRHWRRIFFTWSACLPFHSLQPHFISKGFLAWKYCCTLKITFNHIYNSFVTG